MPQQQDNRPMIEPQDGDELCYEDPGARAADVADAASASGNVAALNAALPGPKYATERRQSPRHEYRAIGMIEPVTTGDEREDVRIITRDASEHGTGFVASGELTEGARAVLHLPAPDGSGETQRIECRVRRSREIGNGLFEGSVEFVGNQPQFSDTRIRATVRKA